MFGCQTLSLKCTMDNLQAQRILSTGSTPKLFSSNKVMPGIVTPAAVPETTYSEPPLLIAEGKVGMFVVFPIEAIIWTNKSYCQQVICNYQITYQQT